MYVWCKALARVSPRYAFASHQHKALTDVIPRIERECTERERDERERERVKREGEE